MKYKLCLKGKLQSLISHNNHLYFYSTGQWCRSNVEKQFVNVNVIWSSLTVWLHLSHLYSPCVIVGVLQVLFIYGEVPSAVDVVRMCFLQVPVVFMFFWFLSLAFLSKRQHEGVFLNSNFLNCMLILKFKWALWQK